MTAAATAEVRAANFLLRELLRTARPLHHGSVPASKNTSGACQLMAISLLAYEL
jgi:hypothetical protein